MHNIFEEKDKTPKVDYLPTIDDLCNSLLSHNQFDVKLWITKFSDYSETEERIPYNRLSSIIFSLNAYEELNLLESRLRKLEKIISDANLDFNDDEKLHQLWIRFYDHCLLACQQKELVNKTRSETENIAKQINDLSIKQQKGTIDLITALSLFSAVVITFFGGFSFITSAMAGMRDTPLLKIILVILTAGFITLNCIFLILYFVSIIINKSIFSSCLRTNKTECSDCKETHCSSIARLKFRLPYIFWIDISIIVLFLTTLIIYYMLLIFSPALL